MSDIDRATYMKDELTIKEQVAAINKASAYIDTLKAEIERLNERMTMLEAALEAQ